MTEDKKKPQEQEESKLDFEKAQNMTVGEAVRKDSEIKAGVTEDDGVLDKYIKQHPEEVASQKFDTIAARYESLDTEALDDFIKQQREELEQSSLLHEETAAPESTDYSAVSEKAGFDSVTEDTIIAEEPLLSSEAEMDSVSDTEQLPSSPAKENPPLYKNRKVLLSSLLILILAVFGVAFGMNYLNRQNAQTKTSSSSASKKSASSSSSSKDSAEQAAKDFDSLYQSFFADEKQTLPKNSEFANLSKLETALKQLADTDYYEDAKSKYDKLSRQIKAIQAVNDKFTSDAIADGKQVESAAVKAAANFDDLSSETLNTGNASLDTLLQKVIAAGREQLAAGSNAQGQSAAGDSPSGEANSATDHSGISGYDSSTLDRGRSRVPYSAEAVADSSNEAWSFNPGVLEKIVATSQERGYISGNDYILEPVNIINGNGYYNMYKPDGTYLFSINCKTGYFVGNASGYSDALDF